MKVLQWFVVIALVVGGAAYLLERERKTTRQQAYELELGKLKREFLAQSVGLRQLDAETYRREVGPAIATYFNKVVELGKKYPGAFDPARETKRTEEEFAAGRLKEPQ